MFWIWIIILLIGLLIVLLPPWPYMQERDLGYGPSAIAFTLILLILLLWWLGFIALWTPRHAPVGT